MALLLRGEGLFTEIGRHRFAIRYVFVVGGYYQKCGGRGRAGWCAGSSASVSPEGCHAQAGVRSGPVSWARARNARGAVPPYVAQVCLPGTALVTAPGVPRHMG